MLRFNSRQFLIAKGLRRDVFLAVLAKAQAKVPHRLYAVCLMANQQTDAELKNAEPSQSLMIGCL